jgi:hypothetical protein
MGLIEEEVVAAVAATAVAVSPRARKVARKGAVYGIAAALKAGDVVASAARGVARGARSTTSTGQPPVKRASRAKQSPSRAARSPRGTARSSARATGASGRT